MPDRSSALDRGQAESLTVELTELVLGDLAPDEIEILDITAAEYFAEPDAVLNPKRRDESLGFGLEVGLLTPYVLAALTPVVDYVASIVLATAREEGRPQIEALVRRIFRLRVRPAGSSGSSGGPSTPAAPDAQADPPPDEGHLALTREQARHVRDLALARARDSGMPDGRARLLADSLVGALVVDG
jgi:hypothetical protein